MDKHAGADDQSREADIYTTVEAPLWAGLAPFSHASGIWGRGKMIEYLADRIGNGETVVDLGCGAGLLTSYLCAMVGSNGEVKGYDGSIPLIAEAAKLEESFSNLSFKVIDVTAGLPDPVNSVDWLVSFMLIQNLSGEQLDQMFHRCNKSLKKDGQFVFLTLHPNFFQEDWTLSFVAYDQYRLRQWRSENHRNSRIDGKVYQPNGNSKPVFSFPFSKENIIELLSKNNMKIIDETELFVDKGKAERLFGSQENYKFPLGPLFWIFSSKCDNS